MQVMFSPRTKKNSRTEDRWVLFCIHGDDIYCMYECMAVPNCKHTALQYVSHIFWKSLHTGKWQICGQRVELWSRIPFHPIARKKAIWFNRWKLQRLAGNALAASSARPATDCLTSHTQGWATHCNCRDLRWDHIDWQFHYTSIQMQLPGCRSLVMHCFTDCLPSGAAKANQEVLDRQLPSSCRRCRGETWKQVGFQW